MAGQVGTAFSTHWTQLILVVIAFAVGEGVFPLVQTIVAAGAGDQRMRSFALVFNVGPSVALAIFPLIGAGMVVLLGMRSAFILGAVFSAISMAAPVPAFTPIRAGSLVNEAPVTIVVPEPPDSVTINPAT